MKDKRGPMSAPVKSRTITIKLFAIPIREQLKLETSFFSNYSQKVQKNHRLGQLFFMSFFSQGGLETF